MVRHAACRRCGTNEPEPGGFWGVVGWQRVGPWAGGRFGASGRSGSGVSGRSGLGALRSVQSRGWHALIFVTASNRGERGTSNVHGPWSMEAVAASDWSNPAENRHAACSRCSGCCRRTMQWLLSTDAPSARGCPPPRCLQESFSSGGFRETWSHCTHAHAWECQAHARVAKSVAKGRSHRGVCLIWGKRIQTSSGTKTKRCAEATPN
jgi:hypothetical protein